MLLVDNYQRNKAFLKYLYLIGIITIIALIYSLLQSTNKFIGTGDGNLHSNAPTKSVEQDNNQMILHKSTLLGLTKDLEPYKVNARKINTISEDQFYLEKIDAIYKIKDQELLFNANTGLLNNTSKLVNLKGNVKISLDNLIIFSDDININLVTKQISSNDKIDIFYKNSKVKADRFTSEDNNVLEFKGNVLTRINMLDF
ncbi:MAG: LPS export ABC transporter periplasmic protein LptC [Janthinobacterium lividum]